MKSALKMELRDIGSSQYVTAKRYQHRPQGAAEPRDDRAVDILPPEIVGLRSPKPLTEQELNQTFHSNEESVRLLRESYGNSYHA